MKKLLAYLFAIKGIAKNTHYRAGGVSFYANHLLANLKNKTLRNYVDAIFEVCFLGNELRRETPPPDLKTVYTLSAELMPPAGMGTLELIGQLAAMVKLALVHIENLNRENALTVGEANLIGGIAQDLQQYHGLLVRVLADAED